MTPAQSSKVNRSVDELPTVRFEPQRPATGLVPRENSSITVDKLTPINVSFRENLNQGKANEVVLNYRASVETPSLVDKASQAAEQLRANLPPFKSYVVQPGDTLSKIAEQQLGDPKLWKNIYASNPGTEPDSLKPGMELQIPKVRNHAIQGWHEIQSGDTLNALSIAAYGHPNGVQSILNANPGLDPKSLQIGTRIRIPEEKNVEAQGYYTVKSGDTFGEIAKQLGVPLETLRNLNDEVNPLKLKIGQRILVPGQSQVVKAGDTIFHLARQAYGDSRQWPLVIAANPTIDPNNLPVGSKLRFERNPDQSPPWIAKKIENFANREIPEIKPAANSPTNVKVFIEKYAALAIDVERISGIPAEVTLAQMALETGWGKRAPGNNYFGIKAQKGYVGDSVSFATKEQVGDKMIAEVGSFRSYSGAEHSVQDYAAFLSKHSRAPEVFNLGPQEFAHQIAKFYATDTGYANKLCRVMKHFERAST